MTKLISKAGAVLLTLSAISLPTQAAAQAADGDPIEHALSGLPLRGIGPALMGGRIADIAVNPSDRSTWFVAVGSGGLWKTTNAGTTWTPVFDEQPTYSIGVVTLDPSNPDIVWVGTGENVSGRHVGWGSGVYRSRDAGATWEQMGLEASEHIGKILVDPRDGDVVLVAAEGPLWSSGGERGVYRTIDGGDSWEAVLEIDENTGVTDIEFDPTNPDTIYAAAYQRRRHIWALLGGGPQSGIYKSTDGGDTWRHIERGLPRGDMGKIGLAVTLADPELVYATVEADDEERGFYRSRDKGESWERRDSYISGGTGPHYYQEIEASPHDPDLIYQMDVFFHVTRDGGATFDFLGTGREKHSDNHALWIDPEDKSGRHLIAGTDAGLYETFDEGTTWKYFPNLPISQFYKVALSNSEPFYDILGGAQDLGTLHGPSRTTNIEGVRNRDWYVPMGADGYGVAIDPTDPHILYLMTQQGDLSRVDRRSQEALSIRPMPAPGEPPERWNWDSPLLISPHDSNRLYFGSQRVWRSDNRGNSWTALSGDLTTNRNRYELDFMGRVWSVDSLYDNGAMSKYATLTAISESPVTEGVLYTGSDDGRIHASRDGGQRWATAAELPDVPDLSFVGDVEASQHDDATVFTVADAHKTGDFSPYVFESSDSGASWRSIAGDLPDGTIIWAIQQDHVDADLLFLATEYGIYFTPNGGTNWHMLSAGAPTIAFRDIKLHRRDNDIVGATFGRGFYILDDYSPLREIANGVLDGDGGLLPVRDAWWYVPSVPSQAAGRPTRGSTAFVAPNPDFGATFTYYLAEAPRTARDERREHEKELRIRGEDAPFPGFEVLREEAVEGEPKVLLLIRDAQGEPVRWIEGPALEGIHRVSWDLRRPAPNPINFSTPGFSPPWVTAPRGPLVAPGVYEAELFVVSSSGARSVGEAQTFEVKPVPTAPGTDFVAVAAFQQETSELMRRISGAGAEMGRARDRLRHMRAALVQTPRADPSLYARVDGLVGRLAALNMELSGDPARQRLDEATSPAIRGLVGSVIGGHWGTRQTPTAAQRASIQIATTAFADLSQRLAGLLDTDLVALEQDLEAAGAPWTPGRKLSQ